LPLSLRKLYSGLFVAGLQTFALAAQATIPAHQLATVQQNPAALSLRDDISDTVMQMDGYIFIDDSDELIYRLKKANDEGRALEGRSRGILVIPGDEAELVQRLEEMRDDTNSFAAGGHFTLSTSSPAWHIIGGSEFSGSARFNYDEDDANRLRFATLVSLFSFGELQSSMEVSALWSNYLGLNYRFKIDGFANTQFGITPKIQNISLIERSILISEYEEEKLFDSGRDVDHTLQLNADLGISHRLNSWLLGLAIKDIYQQEMQSTIGTVYQQRSRVNASIDYQATWASWRFDADLTPQAGFGEMPAQRVYNLKTAIPLNQRIALLLGYRWLNNPYSDDSPSIGLHYSLDQLLNINAEFSYISNNELGGSINLQLPL
jgi:hypothetical protein